MENKNIEEIKEYNEEITNNDKQPAPKRNGAMTFVLILSMIGSGWSILANMISGLSYSIVSTMMESNDGKLPDELTNLYSEIGNVDPTIMNEMFLMFLNIPQYHYFLIALFSALSFTGIILMWKMRKTGFHFYTLAQLMILLLTAILGKAYIGVGDIMMTLLFIAFYAMNIFKPTSN